MHEEENLLNAFANLVNDPVLPASNGLFRVIRTARYDNYGGFYDSPLTAHLLSHLTLPANFVALSQENGQEVLLEGLAAAMAMQCGAIQTGVVRGDEDLIDFLDGNRVPFDVKTPKTGHSMQGAFNSIRHEMDGNQKGNDENYQSRVVLDTTFLSNAEHVVLWGLLNNGGYQFNERLIEICLPYTQPFELPGTDEPHEEWRFG